MLARIRKVWPGAQRTTVIAIDDADQREKCCYVWLSSEHGRDVASLCERVEQNGHGLNDQRVVLTVRPKSRFGYEIEDAELLPSDPQEQTA